MRLVLNYHTSVATAKRALEGFGRSLAAEFASKNIRVNLVAPHTGTPLTRNLLSSEDEERNLQSKTSSRQVW